MRSLPSFPIVPLKGPTDENLEVRGHLVVSLSRKGVCCQHGVRNLRRARQTSNQGTECGSISRYRKSVLWNSSLRYSKGWDDSKTAAKLQWKKMLPHSYIPKKSADITPTQSEKESISLLVIHWFWDYCHICSRVRLRSLFLANQMNIHYPRRLGSHSVSDSSNSPEERFLLTVLIHFFFFLSDLSGSGSLAETTLFEMLLLTAPVVTSHTWCMLASLSLPTRCVLRWLLSPPTRIDFLDCHVRPCDFWLLFLNRLSLSR